MTEPRYNLCGWTRDEDGWINNGYRADADTRIILDGYEQAVRLLETCQARFDNMPGSEQVHVDLAVYLSSLHVEEPEPEVLGELPYNFHKDVVKMEGHVMEGIQRNSEALAVAIRDIQRRLNDG